MEPYFDPEYETRHHRINPPRVAIDNRSCPSSTLVKVDSANKNGILLEVVQVLTDLDLSISKAYISSDGGWFMDVFHVTDQHGDKLKNEKFIEELQEHLQEQLSIATHGFRTSLGVQSTERHTTIELIGTDRPGLLSDIFAVLSTLRCNVECAEVWTHNTRIACVLYITEGTTAAPIEDPGRLSSLKGQLCNVLRATDDRKGVKTDYASGLTHMERRLHQMMFADRDYEGSEQALQPKPNGMCVTIENCSEKGYSIINLQCKDRPKLLFDIVCTLTDMEYVVYHASISVDRPYASQEYYIRHVDGCILDTEGEQQRVIKCIEAAIERRASQGIRLELCMGDRVGLLSDVTRIFREYGLSVTRADVTTRGNKAMNTFYVTDTLGGPVDMKIIETIRKEIGQQIIHVNDFPIGGCPSHAPELPSKFLISFRGLIKSQWERFSSHLGVVKSCS
ncbi:hypothetical protein GOP47_0026300 [Adiantum capillus-veneris]|nr:hypothetical protein GOP47_0026300 [Adiantum capillus-veneris]